MIKQCKTDAQIVFEQLCCVTYKMLSTLSGLMRIAMGWRPAIWRRFIAFPDTSSMQCLPCGRDTESDILSSHTLALFFPIDRVSVSPCQRPLWQTVCWFHTDGCYTVQPRWTCAPESLAPWALWRTWSGNLCHPPRSLSVAVLCLKIRIYTDSGKEIKYLSVQYPAHEHLSAHISLKH